jgi:hypothetical protein|tara:strand:- start:23 stop:268 length:246 start_codon:yes stop_codon:yes gene_type:complete
MTTLSEEFKRGEPSNPFNYSKLNLAKKEMTVREAAKLYPHIPEFYIAMAYDCVENTPAEEMKDIIENKKWENFKKETKPNK